MAGLAIVDLDRNEAAAFAERLLASFKGHRLARRNG
jgi:hypothetical protein